MSVKKIQQTSSFVRDTMLRSALTLTSDDAYDPENGLSAQQWQAIAQLVSGRRQRDIAQDLSVTEETLSRWKNSPLFAAALNVAIKESYDATVGDMRDAARDAVGVLRDTMRSSDEKLRLQAALAVLRLSLHLDASVGSLATSPADIARGELKERRVNLLDECLL